MAWLFTVDTKNNVIFSKISHGCDYSFCPIWSCYCWSWFLLLPILLVKTLVSLLVELVNLPIFPLTPLFLLNSQAIRSRSLLATLDLGSTADLRSTPARSTSTSRHQWPMPLGHGDTEDMDGGIGEKLGSWVVPPNFCGFSFTPWTSSIYLPYSYSQTVEFTWDLILSPHLRHRRLQWPLDHRTPLLETVQQEIRTDGVENTLMEMLYYFELNPNVVEKTT
jgi:hypothetical protein